jgi:hypothetical protein
MPSACVIEYCGKRGKVYRVKYRTLEGRQRVETLGAERDGWTRERADATAREVAAGRLANPIAPLLWLCDTLIAQQEKRHGDVVPHLLVARSQLHHLYEIAEAELSDNPLVFNEASS